MKKIKWHHRKLMLLILCVLIGFSCQRQNGQILRDRQTKIDIETETTKVRAVLDNYSMAWQTKDLSLFSDIFAHDGELIIYDGSPTETYVGWESWIERIQRALEGINIDNVIFREVKIRVHSSGEIAWISGLMDWSGLVQGAPTGKKGVRVTWILEKRKDNWSIVHAHYSLTNNE